MAKIGIRNEIIFVFSLHFCGLPTNVLFADILNDFLNLYYLIINTKYLKN